MSILIDENTRVVVQGITGNNGAFHTGQMLEYGTDRKSTRLNSSHSSVSRMPSSA